jgi:hypothetical protein
MLFKESIGVYSENHMKATNTFCGRPLKLKMFHYTPRRRLGGEEYNSYSFSTSALNGVSGQRHAPAALYSQGKDPRYPLYRRLGGPQSRSGHRGYRKNPFASAEDRTSIAGSFSP